VSVCACVCVHVCLCAKVCPSIHIDVYTHKHVCVCVCTSCMYALCTCLDVYKCGVHMCAQVVPCVHTSTFSCPRVCVFLCVHRHVCVHICLSMCVFVCVCLSVCLCVHVCVCDEELSLKCFYFCLAGIDPGVFHMLGKLSTTELHPYPPLQVKSPCVSQVSLKLTVSPPQPPECWYYRCVPPLSNVFLRVQRRMGRSWTHLP
jgi:hypothetical protein